MNKFVFPKNGLRPWVKDLFGSNCEHVFQKRLCLIGCSFLSNLDYRKCDFSKIKSIEAMNKRCVWINCELFFSPKKFFYLIFLPSKLDYLKIENWLRPWINIVWDHSPNISQKKRFLIGLFLASKLYCLKCDFSNRGLKPWVNEFLDHSANIFFKNVIFDWIFILQNCIIPNLIFRKLDWGHE